MPKAIITGATGYIGSHVAKHLLETGWSVGIIVRQQSRLYNIHDVLDRIDIFEHTGSIHSLADFLKKTSPNVVIHLAAATASNPPIEHIQPLISSNIEFPTQLLEAMCLSNVKHFISTGSYWQNYNSDRYNPVDLYAATKEACEAVLKYYT